MILKASQRGGGLQLAAHLLKPENEHVEVHEVRGFVADDLKGAMKEAQAVAMGTRCKQHLFSVSINPPESETVGIAAFESAIDRVEKANGLTGLPRIIVFHEKEGRRHAHAVWSRIDPDTMTAKVLPFFKMKLREVSKSLYLEHGWRIPRGLVDCRERDANNFSLADWQQAKRLGRDPNLMKALVRECWSSTNSKAAFADALERRGLILARGDRRDYVAVTHDGVVRAIPALIGKRVKEVRVRLGQAETLPTVAEARQSLVEGIAPHLKALIKDADRAKVDALAPLHERRDGMKGLHLDERRKLDDGQRTRAVAEAEDRASRLRGGVMGVWDRLTGRRGEIVRQNDGEALASLRRDRGQRDALVADQLRERRGLQRDIMVVRHRHNATLLELHRDLRGQHQGRGEERLGLDRSFGDGARAGPTRPPAPRRIMRGRGGERGRDGPGFG